jgi:hypothetical protein
MNFDHRFAGANDAKRLGRAPGKVDHAIADPGTAIVDPHDDAALAIATPYFYERSEGEPPVRSGEQGRVVPLATGRPASRQARCVVARDARFLPGSPFARKRTGRGSGGRRGAAGARRCAAAASEREGPYPKAAFRSIHQEEGTKRLADRSILRQNARNIDASVAPDQGVRSGTERLLTAVRPGAGPANRWTWANRVPMRACRSPKWGNQALISFSDRGRCD